MFDRRIILAGAILLIALGVAALAAPELVGVVLVVTIVSFPLIIVFRQYPDEFGFLTKVFFGALAIRLAFGFLVYALDLREFFGGDANTYDRRGALLLEYWTEGAVADSREFGLATDPAGPGWGMTYLVGFLYLIFGKNFLAAQSFVAVIGAATAPLVYLCSHLIFRNARVSRFSAIAIAIFPSFIIWSGQLMKDGLIIFLLVLVMLMVLRLQEKFSYAAVVLLVLSLGGIISLRFYIFYMVAVAVAGSFIIGTTNSAASVFRRTAILILTGVALTYIGVLRTATTNLETYGDLERIQISRQDLASSAESGFGEEVDVSTPVGAISAVPLGLVYLLLAPFPWEVTNLRQTITLPEVLIWWAMLPLLVWGFWYTIRHRLRAAFPILMFSSMLTLAYSIFQGNVGTAYRQRTQIQVFFFMFIAVGWVLLKERRENKKLAGRKGSHHIDAELGQGVRGY